MAEQLWESKVQSTGSEPLAVNEVEAKESLVLSWLRSHGVVHSEVLDIGMNLIDTKRSRNNQARQEALVPASVERFTAAVKAGAIFPPIVLYASGQGKDAKLIIIDGNNRHEAHLKAKSVSVRGVIISDKTPSEMIRLLTVEANNSHGVTPDQAWRLQQASDLVKQGFTREDAAAASGVTLGQLNFADQVKRANARAADARIRDFDRLSDTHKKHLGTLKDDAAFYQASLIAIDTQMTSSELASVTTALKRLGSESARLELLGKVKDERAVEAATRKALNRGGGGRSRMASPKMALTSAIGKILNIDPVGLQRSVLTDEEKRTVQRWLVDAADRILDLQVAMEKVTLDE